MTKLVCLYLTSPFCSCSYSLKFRFQLKSNLLNTALYRCFNSAFTSYYFSKARNRVRMTQSLSQPPDINIVFFDVMDTLVKDPFHQGMHRIFGFDSFEEFVEATNHRTWCEFELV
ncbi:hypothetical protein Gasu2_29220 [Galdieria sulphuraria]|nr:hypothetical protein Gasu2_29220 [Galdieria sulphuraria]